MGFITENFLLQNETARRLYHTYAAGQPILDYHNHLPVEEIAENRHFTDLTAVWLLGDHYKWRAMRANGVAEEYCTGGMSSYEKFRAWAKTVPHTLRNPLYHWTHLELLRYFGIKDTLDESTAPKIWREANEKLQSDELTPQGILKKFNVSALCTTDDPADSLEHHEKIRASGLQTAVFPAFRPDAALRTEDPAAFNVWTERLAARANQNIARLNDFLDALRKRHDYFHSCGSRLSDHGLTECPVDWCTEHEAKAIFDKVRSGGHLSLQESNKFASYLMLFFGHLDAEKGWAKQLHLGALRNVNTRMLNMLGRDTGYDSMGDWLQAAPLAKYLDRLEQDNRLPKIILYNNNPADNYVFATLMGNFQNGGIPGKIQYGASWWFLDQKEGIEWQLNALSNVGLLSRFVGMITDSRSFLSFPRHEYFRRVLCNLLGNEIEAGLLPNDEQLMGAMIQNICFHNAVNYFGLPSVSQPLETPAVAAQ